MAAKGREIRKRTTPSDERRSGDIQTVMLNRIEDAQTSVCAVARHQNDLHAGLTEAGIETQQLFHQQKGIAGLEHLILVIDLVLAVRGDPVCHVDRMTFPQVEQRTRRDRQNQLATCSFHGQIVGHRLLRQFNEFARRLSARLQKIAASLHGDCDR